MITLEDIQRYDVAAVVAATDAKDCNGLSRRFYEEARRLHESVDPIGAEVFGLLGDVTSPRLRIDSDEVFAPMLTLNGKRSPIPTDLDKEYWPILAEWALIAPTPELRARVAEALWANQRGKAHFPLIVAAIEDYLAAAAELQEQSALLASVRIERALQLAASLNQKALVERVIAYIDGQLEAAASTPLGRLPLDLLTGLQRQKQGDPTKYAAIAKTWLERAKSEDVWHLAVKFARLRLKWVDGDERANAFVELAETLVTEAELALPEQVGCENVAEALQIYRQLGGHHERIEALKGLYHELQQQSVPDMGRIEFPLEIDVDRYIEEAIAAVKGKDLERALVELALMAEPPNYQEVRQQLVERQGDSILYYLIPQLMLNREGRVIGKAPSLFTDSADEQEHRMRAELHRDATMRQALISQCWINPARDQILNEHHIRIADLELFVYNNPFIPPGRENLFARGLYFGLTGDFPLALHLLVPQVEHSLRYLYYQNGFIPNELTAKMLQDELNLNKLLFRQETKQILGEDLAFELQGLLIERFGSNLRNNLAHGLVGEADLYSPQAVYLWCIILHLCLMFKQVRPESSLPQE